MIRNLLVLPDGTELSAGTPGQNALRSLQWTHTVNAGTDLTPGSACADSLEAELWVEPGGEPGIAAGDELTLYRVIDGGARTKAGVFTAEKPTRSKRNLYRVLAYDRMVCTEKDLSDWLREAQGSFPMTLDTLVRQVAARCGVTLANSLPRNGSYQVQAFYSDGITGRQLLQWAAQAAGCYLHCNADGALAFGWYTDARGSHSLGPGAAADAELGTVQPYRQDGLSYEDYTTALIDKVQIRQSDTDVGVIYPAGEAGTNALVIQGNLLLTSGSDETLRPVAQALYTAARGWAAYTPCTVSAFADCAATAGELVYLRTPTGRRLQTYLMSAVVSAGETRLESTGNPWRDSVAAVNGSRLNANGKLLEISATIDGLNVKAGDLQDNYTQLQQTVEGLDLTVVKDGEVRTAFAADDASVTISSGVITFASNTLEVKSDNFQLSKNGEVSANGSFTSVNDKAKARMATGSLLLSRSVSDTDHLCVAIWSMGNNGPLGSVDVYGTGADGSAITQVVSQGSFTGGIVTLMDAAHNRNITLDGGHGCVWCTDLQCSGSKQRVVGTTFGTLGLNALETPTPAFGDFGTGVCDADGLCLLTLDPRLAETVSPRRAPVWFLTPMGPGELWVEGGREALVHGAPGQPFAWQVLVPQRGYEDRYADNVDTLQPEPDAGTDTGAAFALWDEMARAVNRDRALSENLWEV